MFFPTQLHAALILAYISSFVVTMRCDLIMIINLIYMEQFDTNGIITALHTVIKYIKKAIYAHMDIHEIIMFIHMYMSHIYTCTDTRTNTYV